MMTSSVGLTNPRHGLVWNFIAHSRLCVNS
jgi:hypothetical protein